MKFNNSKFTHVSFCSSNNPSTFNYTNPSNKDIETTSSTKDVGIIVHEDLSFSKHTKDLVRRYRQFSGWILRSFLLRSIHYADSF